MKNHYKLWIIVSLILVFAAGLIGGILIDQHFIQKKPRPPEKNSVHFPTLEIMARELNLTQDQQEKIKDIFTNNEERFKSLRKDFFDQLSTIRIQLNAEIKSVLTPEQASKFDAMIEKYVSKKRKEMEERKKRLERHQDPKNKGEKR